MGRICLGLMLWLSDRYVCKESESERWRHEISADTKTEKETEEGDRERQRMTAHHKRQRKTARHIHKQKALTTHYLSFIFTNTYAVYLQILGAVYLYLHASVVFVSFQTA